MECSELYSDIRESIIRHLCQRRKHPRCYGKNFPEEDIQNYENKPGFYFLCTSQAYEYFGKYFNRSGQIKRGVKKKKQQENESLNIEKNEN